MGQSIEKFVDNVQIDKSFKGQVSVEHRSNNPKRSFVFVNSLLGKHIPANPVNVMKTFRSVYKKTIEKCDGLNIGDRVTVIGFAETATAFGHAIADEFATAGYDTYYLQTTREELSDAQILCEFQEEHSHATEQYLYGNITHMALSKYIIIVDDEISTGKTVLNMIEKFKSLGLTKSKYIVASICNWMTPENQKKFKKENIESVYLVSGTLKDKSMKVECTVKPDIPEYPYKGSFSNNINTTTYFNSCNNRVPVFKSERSGIYIDRQELRARKDLCLSVACHIGNSLTGYDNNVLILGAEESMYNGILIGENLKDIYRAGVRTVRFHASSRSSIDCMEDSSKDLGIKKNNHLNNKTYLRSCYDPTRKVCIYNLAKYDAIFVITDKEPSYQFRLDTEEALRAFGNHGNVKFIVLNTYN